MLTSLLIVGLFMWAPTLGGPVQPRTYFQNFDVESINPLNWWWTNKNLPNDFRSKALFEIVKCVGLNNDREQCKVLIDKARPLFEDLSTILSDQQSVPISTTSTEPNVPLDTNHQEIPNVTNSSTENIDANGITP